MNKFKQNLDTIGSAAGLVLGIIVIFVFPSQRGLAITIVIACAIYFFIRKRADLPLLHSFQLSQNQERLLNIAFWCVFSASLWAYNTQHLYQRPLAYFILISLAAGIIAVEALNTHKDTRKGYIYLILFQVLLLSLNIRLGMFYEFPSLIGADAFFHASQVQYIVDNGHVPSVEVAYEYAAYPAYHIIVAVTNLLTSVSTKTAIFWSVGLNHIISTVFLYYAVQKVTGPRIGLLAALLFNICVNVIWEGVVNIIPATLVTSWFLLLLYLIINKESKRADTAILISLSIIIIVTHHLSALIILCVMASLYITTLVNRVICRNKEQAVPSPIYVLLFALALMTYLTGTYQYQEIGQNLFVRAVKAFMSMFTTADFGTASGVDTSVRYSLWNNILFNLGFYILLIPGIAGMLHWLTSRKNLKFAFACIAILLCAIIFGTSAFGLRTVLPGRWFPILFVFLAILASGQLFRISGYIKPYLATIVILIFVFLTSFFMITTPNVNKDNPLYALERAGRTQFKATEVAGISTTNEIYTGIIKVDGYYSASIVRQMQMNSTVTVFDTDYVKGSGEEDPGALILVRESIFTEPTTLRVPGASSWLERSIKGIIDHSFLDRFQSPDYSIIYSNGEVTGYLAK